jgi:hypothetical protein
VKRSRAAGVEQGRRAGRKADGTLDRRLKANRAGRGGEAGGGSGEVVETERVTAAAAQRRRRRGRGA